MRTWLMIAALAVGCGSSKGGTVADAPPGGGDGAILPDGPRGDGSSGAVDPSAVGPCAVTTATAQVKRGNRTTPVVAHLPTIAGGGTAPLIVLLPGFQLESARYAPLADRLASHCFVVVRADPPASFLSVDHVAMSQDVGAVLDWALGAAGPLAGKVDAAHVAVAGHSLGGKVATMAAFADHRITALFAIDPVNGGSPLSGYSATLPDIVPADVTPLTIPVGFVGETTNGSGGVGGMPCAPTDQNFQTFYAAATAAPWAAQWDFTGADHMDFVDDVSNCQFVCTASTEGTAAVPAVLASTKTLAVAFARRHLRGDTAMDAYLIGAQVPAGVVAAHR